MALNQYPVNIYVMRINSSRPSYTRINTLNKGFLVL